MDQPLNIVGPWCMKALYGLGGIRKLRAFGMVGIKDQPIRIRMLKCELEKGVPDLPRVGARISRRIKCGFELVAEPVEGSGAYRGKDFILAGEIRIGGGLAVTERLRDLAHGDAGHAVGSEEFLCCSDQAGWERLDLLIRELFSHSTPAAAKPLHVMKIMRGNPTGLGRLTPAAAHEFTRRDPPLP